MNTPEGWKLVPVEPTEEMCRAAESCKYASSSKPWLGGYTPENVEGIYKTMLAVAPTPPAPKCAELHDLEIRGIALDCGFKLKPQPDGTEDLNPYVYQFAREILATMPSVEEVAAFAQAMAKRTTPPAQGDARNDEREGIACFLESMGYHELAGQVFAGMTRPIDEKKRRNAIAQRPAPTPPAQEDEPVGFRWRRKGKDDRWHLCRMELLPEADEEQVETELLYTHPANDELRRAAKEMILVLDGLSSADDGIEILFEIGEPLANLRAALKK
jgi:hypothetical protein